MGMPSDNGAGYRSQQEKQFLALVPLKVNTTRASDCFRHGALFAEHKSRIPFYPWVGWL
jgi:hypothetical protein